MSSAARVQKGYLGPYRHVDDLLEAAEGLIATAANLAALFDDGLEEGCDAAHRAVENARALATHGYQEAIDVK